MASSPARRSAVRPEKRLNTPILEVDPFLRCCAADSRSPEEGVSSNISGLLSRAGCAASHLAGVIVDSLAFCYASDATPQFLSCEKALVARRPRARFGRAPSLH